MFQLEACKVTKNNSTSQHFLQISCQSHRSPPPHPGKVYCTTKVTTSYALYQSLLFLFIEYI